MKMNYKIRTYIFVPIIAVISIQLLALLFIFAYGNVTGYITEESYDNLREKTSNEKNYIENKMTFEWSEIEGYANLISNKIASFIDNNQYDIETVFDNYDVNSQIITNISADLLDMLRATKVTGTYIVIDGKALPDDNNERIKPGLYLRDDDPYVKSSYNSDVMLQIAHPSVTKSISIPLSSTWRSVFNFNCNSGCFSSTDFYDKPFNAYSEAVLSNDDTSDISNFGYWSENYRVDSDEEEIISYSLPLVIKGKLSGVIGIDISINELWNIMNKATYDESDITYIIGNIKADNENSINVVQHIGYLYTQYYENSRQLEYIEGKNGSLSLYKDGMFNKNEIVSYVIPLNLYNTNTPFDSTTWVVVACKSYEDIMEYTYKTRKYIIVFMVITFITMVLVLSSICLYISRPVKNLADEVKKYALAVDGNYTRTNIIEVNELIDSFEEMRQIILNDSNKMSEIVALTKLPLGVYEYDSSIDMTFCSDSLLNMFGWKEKSNKGYLTGELFKSYVAELKRNVYEEENNIYEIRDKDGNERWIQIHDMSINNRDVGTIMDVTSDIVEQKKLEYERNYDVLTGLLNRRAFNERVNGVVKQPEVAKVGVMMMLDSDNLKFINDTYGHDVGDEYLKKIASSFDFFKTSTEKYLAGRFTGDEFYLFIYGYDKVEDLRQLITKYWDYLCSQTVHLPDGTVYNIRCSGGVSWYPDDSSDPKELGQYIDFAMYEMKHNSKGKWTEFNRKKFDKQEFLLSGHKALDILLSKMMIRHMFQPIVAVHDSSIFGYEMLMRSLMSEFSSPTDVLKMARSQSRLDDLEYVSIYKCFEECFDVYRKGRVDNNCRMFINSIGSSKLDGSIWINLIKRFPHNNYDKFVIELTEEDEAEMEDLILKTSLLNMLNFQVAIDDYGTGYSNLVNMLTIDPAYIKIDMGIVRNIDKDKERQFIFRQAISLARSKQAMVIAEGVETKEELECVIKLGVDLVQGYYLGRPSYEFNQINQEAVDVMASKQNKYSI